MIATLLGTVLPWLLVGFGAWLFVQLVLQNGRILLRLDALEAGVRQLLAAGHAQAGLPRGAVAPDFNLPDAAGVRHSLAGYHGRSVLLTFFDPDCGFCQEMSEQFAALPALGEEGQPVPVVVTTGGVAANAGWMRACEGRCTVLFQAGTEVAERYQTLDTPTGYFIDERGLIASDLAVGADALLALVCRPHVPRGEDSAPPINEGHAPPSTPLGGGAEEGERPARGKVFRGLEHSRIKRDGLRAGTPAPRFVLPRLGGGTLTLEGYSGRRVLLVFSDPKCGPCEHLAPLLEAIHRRQADLAVVMISRRDAEANRRKAEALGLTFPIALQKSWEISRLYAMFHTPSGYLLDERGVLTRDVAVGPEAILALAARTGGSVGQRDVVPAQEIDHASRGLGIAHGGSPI